MFNQATLHVIALIGRALDTSWGAYTFAGVYLVLKKVQGSFSTRTNSLDWWINVCWLWNKWPALISIGFDIFVLFANGKSVGVLDWINVGIQFVIWWYYRDVGDDDDDWKKKLKKAVTKVVKVGGKLTVVPETT